MRNKMYLFIFWMISTGIYSQAKTDTLAPWISKYSKQSSVNFSKDGKWAAARKFYDANSDTVMIWSLKKPIRESRIVCKGNINLINGGGALVVSSAEAEFLNPDSGERQHYRAIQFAHALSVAKRYAVCNKEGHLSIYTNNGTKLFDMDKMQGLSASDGEAKLYALRKDDGRYDIIYFSGNAPKKLWSTSEAIRKLELAPSGKQLFLTVTDTASGQSKLVFIGLQTGLVNELPVSSIAPQDEFRIVEIQKGKAYFIDLKNTKKTEEKLVETWYGNDTNLETKIYGKIHHRYWLWKADTGKTINIPNSLLPEVLPVNSDHYFLTLDTHENFNYTTSYPQYVNVQLYDINKNIYYPLGGFYGVSTWIPEIVCDNTGQRIVASSDGKKWTLFTLADHSKTTIEKEGLKEAYFSHDGNSVFFAANEDMYRYEVKRNVLTAMSLAAGQQTKIMNASKGMILPGYNLYANQIDHVEPLIIKAIDNNNKTTIYSWDKGTAVQISEQTDNKVIKLWRFGKIFYTLEENFSMPSQLMVTDGKRHKSFLSDLKNPLGTLPVRQDIISYKTSAGRLLKGILYYPEQYREDKKYPMVVHIYQRQIVESNTYLMPGYNNQDALDVSSLLKRGYFVYLPDLEISQNGAGQSALDCVNKALDAVSGNPNIDMQKVGLTGHSFGGYETDFIATRSKRFAAYISGAGISDIQKDYFSYNYQFKGPYYWQYETGQFNFKTSFTQDKQLYLENNPIYNIEKVSAPILLWAGKKDQNVPWDHTMEFYIGLRRNKKQVIALFYPDGGHAFLPHTNEKKDLYTRILQWWDYFLKDKRNVTWIDKMITKGVD